MKVRFGAILFVGLLLIGALVAKTDGQTAPSIPVRHTLSEGSSLVAMGPAADIWVRITYTREMWISPDGSGRIDEKHLPMSFPSESERLDWIAAGEPTVTPISQDFGPGKLAYLRLDEVPRDPIELAAQLAAGEASPAESLRRVTLLLVETVPPADLTNAIVAAAARIPEVSVEDRGTTVVLSGTTGEPDNVLTTIVLDVRSGQLISEERVAHGQLPSLAADPPILMLERNIKLSESLPR